MDHPSLHPAATQNPKEGLRIFRVQLALSSVLAIILLVGAGYGLFYRQASVLREKNLNDLRAIGDMKADQILKWRHERLTDAHLLSTGLLQVRALEWLSDPSSGSARDLLGLEMEKITEAKGYTDIPLAGPDGELLLSLDRRLATLEPQTQLLVRKASESRSSAFGDLIDCSSCGNIHLDVAAPIFDESDEVAAVLVLRSDPERMLFPLVGSWPLPSETAEASLVRRDGDSVVFLNEVRHADNRAMTLRVGLDRTELTAVQAVLGHTGEYEGKDYRGVDVLAYLRPISDSPWFLLAEVDRTEFLAEVRALQLASVLVILLGILITIGLASLLYVHRSREFYRTLYRSEYEVRKAHEESRATLYAIGDGVISTDAQGRVTRINPVAAALTGWAEAEAMGMPLDEIFVIVNEETRRTVENPVTRVLREKKVVGLANHTLLIARDGTERPIADSGSPILHEGGLIGGVVLVFRDQTEERAAETALRESEEFSRKTLDSLSAHICVLDAEGNIILVNRAWRDFAEKNFGQENAVCEGANYLRVCEAARGPEKEQAAAFAKAIRSVARNETHIFSMEYPCNSPDEKRWFVGRITRYIGSDPVRIIVAHENVTDRRRAEELLRESEQQYRSLVDGSPDLIVRFDREGRHLFVNPAGEALMRKPASWLLGKTHRDLGLAEEVHQFWKEKIQTVFETGMPLDFRLVASDEYRHLVVDWRICPEKSGDQTISVLGVGRDMTESTLLEEKYRTLFEEMIEGVAVHEIICDAADNPVDYRFLEVNPSFERLTGLQARNLIGKTVLEVMPETEKLWIEKYGNVALTGKPMQFEAYSQCLDRHYQVTAFRPRLNQFACIFIDISERLAAEKVLRESEARFRLLYEQSPLGYHSLNSEGNLIEVNPAWLELMGYEREEVIGRWFGDFLEADQIPAFEANFANFKKKGVTHTEYRAKRKDGTVLHIALDGRIGHDSQGQFEQTHCVVHNVTERRQAEDALRRSEAKQRAMIENIADVIAIMDTDGINQYKSPNLEKWFGWKPEELVGRQGLDCIHPDDKAWSDGVFERLLQGGNGTAENGQCRYRCKDGSYKWIDVTAVNLIDDPNIAGILVNYHDITERKQAQETIRENESRLRKVFEILPVGLWFADKNGQLIKGNPAGQRIWGGEPLVGMEEYGVFKARRVDTGEELKPEDWALARAIREGLTIEDEELEIDALDGKKRIILNYAAPVLGADEQVEGAVVVNLDITERRQDEIEKEKLKSDLLQSQKMESVGRLAGGVAHDFNNMLGVIIGHTEMALENLSPKDELFEDILEIRKAAERSANLTRQLLAFARKQTISPKVLDLNDTISGMVQMLRRLIGEDINLIWKPGPNPWAVRMDPSQVDQILANLAVNSRDALSKGGDLVIETANATFDEEYCRLHPGYTVGDYVLLSISDTGSGMDQETMDHLFEPFFTTKETGKGTGLGLATVYGIIKQNNGFINVYSEPGSGTTFRIYLPRVARSDMAPAAAEIQQPARGTETVLLTEDEEAILNLGRSILKKYGYTVLSASNPAEALRIAEEYDGPIDLLITDVVMPGMNGRQLLDHLNTLRPGMKALFMSGYTADVIAHHGIIDEGVEFLQKPFSVHTLAKRVREILG